MFHQHFKFTIRPSATMFYKYVENKYSNKSKQTITGAKKCTGTVRDMTGEDNEHWYVSYPIKIPKKRVGQRTDPAHTRMYVTYDRHMTTKTK